MDLWRRLGLHSNLFLRQEVFLFIYLLLSPLIYQVILIKQPIWIFETPFVLNLLCSIRFSWLKKVDLFGLCGPAFNRFDWQSAGYINAQSHNCHLIFIPTSLTLKWCQEVCDITFFKLCPMILRPLRGEKEKKKQDISPGNKSLELIHFIHIIHCIEGFILHILT